MARKVTRWADVKHKNPERMGQVRAEVHAEILECDLAQLRQMVGKTQEEVAAIMSVSQGQVSTTEAREDHKLSTLRRYVQALGGELEVIANMGDKRLRLHSV